MASSPAVETLGVLYQEQFVATQTTPWLSSLRQHAYEEFVTHGFPSTKEEAWKYTNLRKLATTRFAAQNVDSDAGEAIRLASQSVWWKLPAYRVVVINNTASGAFYLATPLPTGVTISSIDADPGSREAGLHDAGKALDFAQIATSSGRPFVALNTALFRGGIQIDVAAETRVDKPIHVVYLAHALDGGALAAFPRLFMRLGARAQATLLELHVGEHDVNDLTDAVTELVLREQAQLQHIVVHKQTRTAFHVGTASVRQHLNSLYRSHVISFGGALTRQELHTALIEPGAQARLWGLNLGQGQDHIDSQTDIDHRAPACLSRETYKSVLHGQASSVFNGRVIVRHGADGTDAKQSNHNLLLSDAATANSKPQLEIFADDVKCAHGATVGLLDEEAIHYLRSRGIADDEARAILVLGFANEVLDEIEHEGIRETLRRQVSTWLAEL